MPENPKRVSKKFTIILTETDEVRIEFEREAGTIVKFSVQYLAKIEGLWCPIVRFDTAHRQPHIDILYPDGTKETRTYPFYDYNTALTYAIAYIKEHWHKFRERYERQMRWKEKSSLKGTTNY